MENAASPISMLIEKAEDYAKTTLTLYKLTTVQKSANIVSGIVSNLALLLIAAFFMLMLSIGTAVFIGELFGKMYYGFFAMSGFYLLTYAIVYIFRLQLIKKPARNAVVTEMLKKFSDEE